MTEKNRLIRFHYGENNINTGPLKEIPEICIDHFHGEDLDSCAFFLSHAHTDHLVGLETDAFMRRLNQPGVKLYCHPITPILLESFERYLGGADGIRALVSKRKIVVVDVWKTLNLTIPRRASKHLEVRVTFLPAGHCPGSVMFLFETSTTRILHTGDFRLTLDDLKSMPQLHGESNIPKQLDHLYVDTTFCSKSASLFPDRKKVLEEAIEQIRNWISLSKQHVVHISFSAKFAHEYILQELYKVFRQKIHVTPERRRIYQNIPEVFACVTLDSDTQLHLCGDRDCVEKCYFITLRLSSMWYTYRNNDNRSTSWNGKTLFMCYAMHSSLDEIAKTIDYLKPKVVTPLVMPVKSDVKGIHDALQERCTTKFIYEDYRSNRDDFKGPPPDVPCTVERDATDAMEVEEEPPGEDASHEDPCDASSQEPYQSPKKIRLDETFKSAWQYVHSPSPIKYSQSSSEGSQSNSQELNSQTIEDMTPPPSIPMKSSIKRNLNSKFELSENCSSSSCYKQGKTLSKDALYCHQEGNHSESLESASDFRITTTENDDSLTLDSQQI